MTPQQIVGLAVRLLAIWLGWSVILWFTGTESQPGLESFYTVSLLFLLLLLLIAILLWFFPMTVAHKLIPRTKSGNTLQAPAQEAVSIACIVFALCLLVMGILPGLAFYIPAFLTDQTFRSTPGYWSIVIAPIVIKLAVALLVLLKARQISAFLFLKNKEPEIDESTTDETAG